MIRKISTPYAIAHTGAIRRTQSASSELAESLYYLGTELGKHIIESYFLDYENIVTPMEQNINILIPRIPYCVVFTTKDEMQSFARGLSEIIRNCVLGYMDFRGRRGLDALNSPVRSIEMPYIGNAFVDTVIVAKATLATGCTAESLAKTAYTHFQPKRLVIASIFYTLQGLIELTTNFPNADIFVVGEADSLNENGMLIPGIGNLEKRMKGN